MHGFILITSNQYPNKFPTNCINNTYLPLLSPATPVRPVYTTGQTGLACVQLKSKNPEYLDA